MEWMNNFIFDAWKYTASFPIPVRQVIFLLIATFIVAAILFVIMPFLMRSASHVVTFLFNKLAGLMSWSVHLWVKGRRKRNKGIPAIVNLIEFLIDLITQTAKGLKKLTVKRPEWRAKFKKGYKWITVVIIIGFPFLYGSQTDLKVSQKWDEVETWMLRGQSAAAVSQIISNGEQAEGATGVLLQLQSGYTGAQVREKPSLNASAIDVLDTGEIALFLEEKKTVDNINWLLIKLENGKEGWVSGNIVKKYEN